MGVQALLDAEREGTHQRRLKEASVAALGEERQRLQEMQEQAQQREAQLEEMHAVRPRQSMAY